MVSLGRQSFRSQIIIYRLRRAWLLLVAERPPAGSAGGAAPLAPPPPHLRLLKRLSSRMRSAIINECPRLSCGGYAPLAAASVSGACSFPLPLSAVCPLFCFDNASGLPEKELRKSYGRVLYFLFANKEIIFTFVRMEKTIGGKKVPNAHRTRSKNNPIAKKVVVLMRNNITIGIFTNALGALGALGKEMPSGLNVDLPSYSTINRMLVEVGKNYDIATPVGVYSIGRHNLYRFVV